MAFARGNIIIDGPLDQVDLFNIAQDLDSVCVGSTIDVVSEVERFEKEHYTGIMFYCRTQNMFKAENRLLKFPGSHNTQKTSSARSKDGYIYVFRETTAQTKCPTKKKYIKTKGPLDQADLFTIAEVPDSIRVGSTIDIDSEVERFGKERPGIMYYSRTQNMFKAENRLLEFPGRHNTQKTSSARSKDGYIYVFRETPARVKCYTNRKVHTSRKTFTSLPTHSSRPAYTGAANVTTAEVIEFLKPALQTSHQVHPARFSKHHPSATTSMSTKQQMSAVASEDVIEIPPPAPVQTASSKPSPSKKASAVASEDVIEIPPPAPAIIIPTASSKPSPSKKAAGSSRRDNTVPRGKLVKIGVVSQEHLIDLAKNPSNVRVGSTIDMKQRAVQYEEEGYSGDIFYTKAENMRKAEDKLLKHPGRYNVQRQSGAKERRGYIYVILGQKH